MREIEIKLRVDNLEELEKKLTDSGLVISKEITQHDVVYSKDTSIFSRMLKEGEIVMRIRRENGVAKITLKQQKTNELDNTEHETEVGDGDTMHQILLTLGWKPEIEVKKVRKKGKMGDYEICLDKVEELGEFIEIEKMVDDNADAQQVIKELFEVAKSLGLSEKDEEKRGYDTQLYQLKNK